jgi:hypothetical protein
MRYQPKVERDFMTALLSVFGNVALLPAVRTLAGWEFHSAEMPAAVRKGNPDARTSAIEKQLEIAVTA